MSKISFGISGFDLPAQDIIQLAKTMEKLGFSSLWWGEHAVVPRGDGDNPAIKAMLNERTHLADPLLTLAAISQVTSALKLGAAILLAPLWHPLTLARATATMFDLIGDRFLCGVGGGWLKAEFEAMEVPFNERGRRLDDTIEILRKAWSGGAFTHSSRYFEIPQVQITPHPTPVTLIVGGHSPNALARAALRGDGWIYSAPMEIGKVCALHGKLQAARTHHGVQDRRFRIDVPTLSMSPKNVDAVIEAGFTNIILSGEEAWPRHLDTPGRIAHLTQRAIELGVGVR
jgi:probable F420-dependent oxidoreductase